jgi:hypothetical protein
MATGAGLVELAKQHIGEDYEFVLVPKNNANWRGPWDCAELMSWLVFQEAGNLYGCVDNNANPASVEAYTGAWKSDSAGLGRRIAANKAAAIVCVPQTMIYHYSLDQISNWLRSYYGRKYRAGNSKTVATKL